MNETDPRYEGPGICCTAVRVEVCVYATMSFFSLNKSGEPSRCDGVAVELWRQVTVFFPSAALAPMSLKDMYYSVFSI